MRQSKLIAYLKNQAKQIKEQTLTVYFLARDPRCPILIRLLSLVIAAYALSPIDLIPDFIPILGYLDELIIIPVGLALVIRYSPKDLLEASRTKAQLISSKPISYIAAFFVILLWLIVGWCFMNWVFKLTS
jgi:uncharacterized membrane protein YkvA (DUF1232 family)